VRKARIISQTVRRRKKLLKIAENFSMAPLT
jgi:hypothetical protein